MPEYLVNYGCKRKTIREDENRRVYQFEFIYNPYADINLYDLQLECNEIALELNKEKGDDKEVLVSINVSLCVKVTI